jgi:hypothetical protein
MYTNFQCQQDDVHPIWKDILPAPALLVPAPLTPLRQGASSNLLVRVRRDRTRLGAKLADG